jgi:hypothetical protein
MTTQIMLTLIGRGASGIFHLERRGRNKEMFSSIVEALIFKYIFHLFFTGLLGLNLEAMFWICFSSNIW